MKTSSLVGAGILAGLASMMSAHASMIVAPHTAARDADLGGATSAAPHDAGSALLINPAGVVGPLSNQVAVAIAPFNLSGRYRDPGRGYDQTGSHTPIALDLWYGFGDFRGWSLGAGVYGSVGAAFEFAEDPNAGQTAPFVGKLSLVNLGLVAGRQITPKLRAGFQIAPNFAHQELQTPSPEGDVRFKHLHGFGVSGLMGLVYDVTDDLSLGLAYRTRGYTKISGDGTVGGVEQDIDVDLYTPQGVTVGAAYDWSDKLRLLTQVKWTRYRDFEHGRVEFETTTTLNQPFIASTRDRLRYWGAFEYQLLANATMRVGYSYESWMIEPSALRPTLYDNADSMIMAGYEVQHGSYNIGFTYGYSSIRQRRVDSSVNPIAPGIYDKESRSYFGMHITWSR